MNTEDDFVSPQPNRALTLAATGGSLTVTAVVVLIAFGDGVASWAIIAAATLLTLSDMVRRRRKARRLPTTRKRALVVGPILRVRRGRD